MAAVMRHAVRLENAVKSTIEERRKEKMKNDNTIKACFAPMLRKASFAAWAIKLVPIPIGIVSARLMSDVVTKAVGGKINGVLFTSAVLLAITVGMKIFSIFSSIAYEKASSQATHQCKLLLYRRFLSNPLHRLYTSENGDAVEKLNNDFNTVTGKSLSLYPGFWVGIVTTAAYFAFLALQSPLIALSLLVISLLQIIPPAVVKNFMKVNYDNCRKIEADITDFTVEGYRGFATIKLYGLKPWWIGKMKALHKRYLKIGNMSTYTARAENAMDTFLDSILKYGTYGIVGLFVLLRFSPLSVGVEAIALSGELFSAVKTVFSSIPDFAVAKTAEKRLSGWFGSTESLPQTIRNTDVSLSGVSYSYEGKRIFNDIGVTLDGSKICLIKGANGAGKSTLFRLITGLLKENSGKIRVGGISPESLSEEDFPRKVFYLPQEDASFDISAGEMYEMIVPGNRKQAENCAFSFGLTEKLINESKISELSGGERKKVFLALAFTLNPPILLLDEPTNSLDDKSKAILCDKLKARGSGALIITHDSVFDAIAQCFYTVCEGGVSLERIGQNA